MIESVQGTLYEIKIRLIPEIIGRLSFSKTMSGNIALEGHAAPFALSNVAIPARISFRDNRDKLIGGLGDCVLLSESEYISETGVREVQPSQLSVDLYTSSTDLQMLSQLVQSLNEGDFVEVTLRARQVEAPSNHLLKDDPYLEIESLSLFTRQALPDEDLWGWLSPGFGPNTISLEAQLMHPEISVGSPTPSMDSRGLRFVAHVSPERITLTSRCESGKAGIDSVMSNPYVKRIEIGRRYRRLRSNDVYFSDYKDFDLPVNGLFGRIVLCYEENMHKYSWQSSIELPREMMVDTTTLFMEARRNGGIITMQATAMANVDRIIEIAKKPESYPGLYKGILLPIHYVNFKLQDPADD